MTKNAKTLMIATLFGAGIAIAGCGEDPVTACGDGGCADAGARDAGVTLYGITPGASQCYVVESVSGINDACNIGGFATSRGITLAGSYDGATQTFALGRLVGSPLQPALGSGRILFNTGTITRNATSLDANNCMYQDTVSGNVNVIATDTFQIAFAETFSNFAGCSPAPATCTSSWTWVVKKAPCADGGI